MRTNMEGPRVLHVDADADRRGAVGAGVGRGSRFELEPEPVGAAALETLADEAYDCVVVGHPLPDGTTEFVAQLRGAYPDLPVLTYAPADALDAAGTRELFRAGVTDHLVVAADALEASTDALTERISTAVDAYHERRRETASEEAFRALSGALADAGPSVDERVTAVLAALRSAFDVDMAALMRVADGELRVAAADTAASVALGPDDVLPLAETYCEPTVRADRTVSFGDVDETAVVGDATLPDMTETYAAERLGFECYLGTPVAVAGEPYGTVCVADGSTRAGFAAWERSLLELAGAWLGRELDHEQEKTDLRHADADAGPGAGAGAE